ncbi:DUF3526 domain-containing protein [Thalassotalea hakodatensis]|uniref:DUF3526 domain-containing protein n=1 Tax=Thalassotalea hakodatensis TaxID=3030492 RepID=UPI002572E48C|nr:DUF3526 domain-containing protein [Thalassotalea hakodatensis]
MHWLKFEIKLLLSSVVTRMTLLLVITCALFAIKFGDNALQQQKQAQAQSQAKFEQTLTQYQKQTSPPTAGHLGYYLFGATQWQLSPWSALFIGQSQTAYADMPVRALALQGQIYTQEMLNPNQQKAGRLDLGFVFIYLMPLLLGALAVTTLSDERQANRWRILNSLVQAGTGLIWRRLILCGLLVLGLSYSLLVLAVIWLNLNISEIFWWLICALALYLCFWSLVVALIICLGKNSVFNTFSFVAIWLAITILLPASIQLYLNHQYQDHPALAATLEQRMIMNNGWDAPPQQAFQQFIKLYPQYQNFELPDASGSWPWYYAQQHLSDVQVNHQWQQYLQQSESRFETLKALSWLTPSLQLQLNVNHLAGSDGESYLHYLKSIDNYHQEIREYLYQHLYTENKINQHSLPQFPRFNSQQIQSVNWSGLLKLVVLILVLLIFFDWRRKKLPEY